MTGMIEKIIVHVPAAAPAATETPAPTDTPAPGAGSTADFTLTGLVDNELVLSDADLRALEVVNITAEHPRKVPRTTRCTPEHATRNGQSQAGGHEARNHRIGWFTAEVFLAEVQAIPDCLVAFTDTPGVYNMVMPTLPSSVWTKGVVKIEVK